ncbi:MAG: DUF1571 domain-containing protein [Archangiaceae bacterium]|nr:DUF1571 domain-containing protein [Archangiaceae bacterium]
MLWLWVVVLGQAGDAGLREAAEKVMTETPQRELIAMGQQAVKGLGPYRYRMAKQERVGGELLPVQEVEVFVREQPFAVRLHFVGGPGKGRKVLYNPKEQAEKFRVREAGVLGVFGGLWIGVDSSLAKKDSNHTVREAGMGALLARFAADLEKAERIGGMKIVQEGWDAKGKWCSVYVAPNGGKGLLGGEVEDLHRCRDAAARAHRVLRFGRGDDREVRVQRRAVGGAPGQVLRFCGVLTGCCA